MLKFSGAKALLIALLSTAPNFTFAYYVDTIVTLNHYPSTGHLFVGHITGEVKDTSALLMMKVITNTGIGVFPFEFPNNISASPEPINWSVDVGNCGIVTNYYQPGTSSGFSFSTSSPNLLGTSKPLPTGSGKLSLGIRVPSSTPLQIRKVLEIPYRNGRLVDVSASPSNSIFTEAGLLGAKFINKSEALLGDPVNIMDGSFYEEDTDLVIPGAHPIVWSKRYSSNNFVGGSLGRSWKTNHPFFLELNSTSIKAADQEGNILEFTQTPTDPNLWEVTESANPLLRTLPNTSQVHLKETITRTLEGTTVVYTHQNPTYNTYDVITSVVSSSGQTVTYGYTGPTSAYYLLASSTSPTMAVTFNYNPDGLLVGVYKPNYHTLLNTYTSGKVTTQQATLASSVPTTNATFVYTTGKTTAANVHGHKSEHEYAAGKLTKVMDRNGQTQTYEWFSPTDTSLGAFSSALKSSTSSKGAITAYSYTSSGQIESITTTQSN